MTAGRVRTALSIGMAGVAIMSVAAADATPHRTIVRVYDVRITGETKSTLSGTFRGSDQCVHQYRTSGKQTWSSLHKGVRVAFTDARLGPITPTSRPGSLIRTVRYTDNGLTCGSVPDPPCTIDRRTVAPARFDVRQPTRGEGTFNLGFKVFALGGPLPLGMNPCGSDRSPEVTADGGYVDVSPRRVGSSYRLYSQWMGGTHLTAMSKWRPSLARLPYPFDTLYAGKPLTIRATDTKDETRLFDSWAGSVTIVFTPTRRR